MKVLDTICALALLAVLGVVVISAGTPLCLTLPTMLCGGYVAGLYIYYVWRWRR